MKLRRRFLPNNLADWSSFLFILIAIPIFYWFELFFVLPIFYEYSSPWFWCHFLFGSFVMKNLVSNLLAVMFIDTSSLSIVLPAQPNCDWKYCAACQLPVPPRCWHCDVCNRCIIKRDHHCTFAGCCVGHFNQRFFMWFLFYFFVGCCYALYLNLFFILPRIDWSFLTILKMLSPIMLVLFDMAEAFKYLLLMLLALNLVGLGITGALLYFHLRLVFKGSVSYEHNRNITLYNYGLKSNIVSIFGSRWYLTWISPFLESKLLLDGVDWNLENVVVKLKYP